MDFVDGLNYKFLGQLQKLLLSSLNILILLYTIFNIYEIYLTLYLLPMFVAFRFSAVSSLFIPVATGQYCIKPASLGTE